MKPRFVVATDGELTLLRNPLPHRSAPAFRLQIALFERFAREVRAAGATSLVAIFPDRSAISDARRGRPAVLSSLTEELAKRGIDYLDLTGAFTRGDGRGEPAAWFTADGHYSPAGNRAVAEWLGPAVLERAAAPPP